MNYMPERSLPPDFPDFTRPMPIPKPDKEGVDLSILGLNEVFGPSKNGEVRAVTGQLADLAMRGYLAIHATPYSVVAPPHFSLHRPEHPGSTDELHIEERDLLTLVFQGREQGVSLQELSKDHSFLPNIKELQKQTRKRLTEGGQYIGISSVGARRLRPLLIVGGLVMAGVAVGTSELPLGIIGGVTTAIGAFDPMADILEKIGRQMLGEEAIEQYEQLLTAAQKHLDKSDAIVDFLRENDASRVALAAQLSASGAIHSYERTLGYLKIPKNPVFAHNWAVELAYLYDAVPQWFSTPELQPDKPYKARTMAVFLTQFLAFMDSAIGKRDR
jgi:hypothetical protein